MVGPVRVLRAASALHPVDGRTAIWKYIGCSADQRAVVVEGGDALGDRHEVGAALVGDAFDEVEDRGPGRAPRSTTAADPAPGRGAPGAGGRRSRAAIRAGSGAGALSHRSAPPPLPRPRMPKGRPATPTAERAWRPASGPKAARITLREAVYDVGLAVESGGGIDHAEDAGPAGDAVEVAKRAPQAAEHGERGHGGEPPRDIRGDLGADPSERAGERSVGRLRPVAGDEDPAAKDVHPGEGERDPRGHLQFPGAAPAPRRGAAPRPRPSHPSRCRRRHASSGAPG